MVAIEQKVCLITGGNAGIGKAAAIQLAQYGFKVIIGCRNESRGIVTRDEIREISKNPNVDFLPIDMASQRSIKTAAVTLKSSCKIIDVLIHNAADFDISRKSQVFTEDDVESVWATNHVGPVLLTNLLMDQLKSSAQGRVILLPNKTQICRLNPYMEFSPRKILVFFIFHPFYILPLFLHSNSSQYNKVTFCR